MSAGDPNFCAIYTADPQASVWIEEGNEDFYVRYQRWITQNKPTSLKDMTFFFQNSDKAREKLKAGEAPNVSGGVLQEDCKAFSDFVRDYQPVAVEPDALANAKLNAIASSDNDLLRFRAALRNYFFGEELTDDEKWILNGALFVQVEMTPIAAGGKGDKRLYAIPGIALVGFDRNLDDRRWALVDQEISKALNAVRSNVINVAGAVQLRFGGDKAASIYEPVEIGGGMVIMGRN
ncbi:MAG: hypothetical protein M9955_22610 [Rhizobiaceae bacterium]|nr:hypothetical protein [Rhizobiaceae bacterium]